MYDVSEQPTCQKNDNNPIGAQKQHLILRLPSSSTREKFESALHSIGESLDNFDVTIEVDSIATIRNLVKKDIGVSILSKSACYKEINKGSLVALPIENLSMIRETAIVYHRTFSHPDIIEGISKAYNDMANALKNKRFARARILTCINNLFTIDISDLKTPKSDASAQAAKKQVCTARKRGLKPIRTISKTAPTTRRDFFIFCTF